MPRVTARFARADDPRGSILDTAAQQGLAHEAKTIAEQTITPLQRWEGGLQRPVNLLIVPLFAFLNAGVALPAQPAALLNAPVALATGAGLAIGKAIGVVLFAALGLRLGICRMPDSMRRGHLAGIGMLAGVGFTMSLFINSLAFEGNAVLETDAKLGILAGSLVSALFGITTLLLSGPGAAREDRP
jgi:NhaA family Na+:H+ antiporter